MLAKQIGEFSKKNLSYVMYGTKSRLTIRVLNCCSPHVNVKCMNDLRKSDNQTSECVS